MPKDNKRTTDARRAAMDRTRVRMIATGRSEREQKKQQDRLSRQEQKMAEKLERQETRETRRPSSSIPVSTPRSAPAPRPTVKEPKPKKRSSAGKTKSLFAKKEKPVDSAAQKQEFQIIIGGKSKKILRLTGIVALIVVIAVIINSLVPISLWEYTQNVVAGTGTGDGFPVAVSSSDTNHILSVGSDIALLGDSSLLLYKSNGKLLFDRQHGFSDPAICSCSARVMVYDRGGKGVRMENRAKTLFTMEAKGAVTTACMADNGYFAIVTRGSDYISDATVYNAAGKEKFVWHSSSRQIIGIALSDNGRYMAVSTLHVESGEAVTGIMLFDTRKGTTLLEETVKGSLPISLDCKGTTTVAVLSDRILSITKTGKRTEYLYDGGTLTCFDNQMGYGTVLVLGMYQDTQNNRLLILDKNLNLLGQADLTKEPLSISARAGTVALLADEQVLFYNRKGVMRGETPLESDAKTLLCKGNRAILLGSDRLEEVHK